jgi:SAM-dependent methyltransferase
VGTASIVSCFAACSCPCPWPWLPATAPAQTGEEVPFITTPDNVTLAMLKLAGVGPRDHVIDLGSGDGRIVITAARRFGASGLGVEIVPDLVAAQPRRGARRPAWPTRVDFREQDLFTTDLSAATVITMYLLPEVNLQLRPALLKLAPGTRIVSHDWDMGDWLPDETLTVDVPDKKIGREKKSRLHRWVVPARAEGLWCGPPASSCGCSSVTSNCSCSGAGAAANSAAGPARWPPAAAAGRRSAAAGAGGRRAHRRRTARSAAGAVGREPAQ